MRKVIPILLTVLLTAGIILGNAAENNGTQNTQANRYNVVFVTDASNSMTWTDPNQYRFEAIDLFIGLLANGGNKVGSVVFNTGVVSTYDLKEIGGRAEKEALSKQIRSQQAKGYTDIGSGLKAAVDMLDREGNRNLPSIILLLTDGITELGTEEETRKSIEKKEDALEAARQAGYAIYTISLNDDNSANTAELQQIARATGGQFQEVSDAGDLQSVFDLYYQMIYSTQSLKLVDEQVPESGTVTRDFSVIDLGVEEVNIVIFGDITGSTVTRPDSTQISGAQLDEMLYESETFSLIKIASPEKGNWRLTVEAPSGSTVKIFKIYNLDLKVHAEIASPAESYKKDEEITFVATISENNIPVTDMSRYAGYRAKLLVKDYLGNLIAEQTAETPEPDGFRLTFIPKDYGTYYAQITVQSDETAAESEILPLNVGNTAPVATEDTVKWHINRWPFLFKTRSTYDLTGLASDAEDDTLQYRIASSTWMEEDYTLSGSSLTIDRFSVSKGSFTVEAYDSMGAFCRFEIRVTSTNIGVWVVVLILVGAVLFLLVFAFLTYRSLGIPFVGEFTVGNIATSVTAKLQKSRGRLKLTSFGIGDTGLDRGAYFQASGKNFVYFKSRKAVYADSSFRKTKKVKIESRMEVRISPDADYEKGITVRFDSFNDSVY